MQEQPLVSIIIPTYNRAHLIGETLDSVLAQTYQNWECIVVDDGSTDGTDALMAEYVAMDSRFQYHHRPDSHLPGGNGARNYGFKLSRGKYIQWFDDDDIMLPQFLKLKVSAFKAEIDLVICSGRYVKDNLQLIKEMKVDVYSFIFKEYVMKSVNIFTPSVLFRRTLLERDSLFSCNLLRSQEAELFSRIFFPIQITKYKVINHRLFLYRQHVKTKSSHDAIYNTHFKFSHFYVHSENLSRGLVLKDQEITRFCYKKIIILLMESIKNKDKSLTFIIISYFQKIFTIQAFVKIKLIVFTLENSQFGKYRLRNYLLNFKMSNIRATFLK